MDSPLEGLQLGVIELQRVEEVLKRGMHLIGWKMVVGSPEAVIGILLISPG